MMVGQGAIFLNALGLMSLVFLLVVLVVSVATMLKPPCLRHYSAVSRLRVLWFVGLAPWIAGILVVLMAVVSWIAYRSAPHAYNFLGWHHFDEFILSSWHGSVVIVAVIGALIILFNSLTRAIRNLGGIRLLDALAESGENKFLELRTDKLAVFTAGLIRPRCYITTALSGALDGDERAIIQLHENEHVRCHDPLKKWLFQSLVSFFPKRTSRYLNDAMTTAMEQRADLAVSQVVQNKFLIAMTMLKVHRLTAESLDSSLVCHFGLNNVEQRIRYLLSEREYRDIPLSLLFLAGLLMSVMCAFSADILHHGIEYLLAH